MELKLLTRILAASALEAFHVGSLIRKARNIVVGFFVFAIIQGTTYGTNK